MASSQESGRKFIPLRNASCGGCMHFIIASNLDPYITDDNLGICDASKKDSELHPSSAICNQEGLFIEGSPKNDEVRHFTASGRALIILLRARAAALAENRDAANAEQWPSILPIPPRRII